MKKYMLFFVILFLFLFNDIVYATKAPIDVTKMSISDLQTAMDNGYLDSETLVNIYLERINKYDYLFNSINQINNDAVEEAKKLDKERDSGNVRGPLHGIPILVKTNIDVVGMSTTAGAKALSDNYPIEDAYVIKKLKESGAIILGSTNMSELAFSASNSYSSYGHVRNAFNVDFTSYGSSGGSAVAIAASFAAASLGTDTNSSVRIPAAGAGLVGIRPTLGLVSRSGVIPYDIERDTVGVITKTVQDSSLILNVISGEDENDSYTAGVDSFIGELDSNLEGVSIGVVREFVQGKEGSSIPANKLTDPEIYEMLEKSIKMLEENGAKIVYLDDFFTSKYYSIATSTYAGITMCDNFNNYIEGTTGTIRSFQQLASSSGHVQRLTGYAKGCGGKYKDKSYRDSKKSEYRNHVDSFYEEYDLDVILYPSIKNEVYSYKSSGVISPGSTLSSVIGYPAITVPMGFSEAGFAYGIEFMGQAYEEDIIYNVALAYESTNGSEVTNTLLAPSLYEVPDEVIKVLEIYNSDFFSRFDNEDVEELYSFIVEYFDDYSNNDDYISDAKEILDRYEETKQSVDELKNSATVPAFSRFFVLIFEFLLVVILIIVELFRKKRIAK